MRIPRLGWSVSATMSLGPIHRSCGTQVRRTVTDVQECSNSVKRYYRRHHSCTSSRKVYYG
jgi:hypothetical protein